MAASSSRHLFLAALVAVLAVAAPRAADAWGGGRFFFSKTARAEAAPVEEPERKAADPNAAPALSRPSTGGSGRGYGLYGRPEENYPPDYFHRGVHRNAEKLTTTTTNAVPATTGAEGEGAGGRAERVQPFPENGSGRGRPATTGTEDEAVPVAGDLEGVQAYPEDGSGRGRPPWYYTAFRGGRQRQQGLGEQRGDYGMSDTRLYQNGRYYYDVETGRYGYGRESNPTRTRPEEVELGSGSGYGRPRGAGDDRRGRYGDAAGYQYQQQYGNDNSEFGNGAMDQNQNGFQEEGQSGRYLP